MIELMNCSYVMSAAPSRRRICQRPRCSIWTRYSAWRGTVARTKREGEYVVAGTKFARLYMKMAAARNVAQLFFFFFFSSLVIDAVTLALIEVRRRDLRVGEGDELLDERVEVPFVIFLEDVHLPLALDERERVDIEILSTDVLDSSSPSISLNETTLLRCTSDCVCCLNRFHWASPSLCGHHDVEEVDGRVVVQGDLLGMYWFGFISFERMSPVRWYFLSKRKMRTPAMMVASTRWAGVSLDRRERIIFQPSQIPIRRRIIRSTRLWSTSVAHVYKYVTLIAPLSMATLCHKQVKEKRQSTKIRDTMHRVKKSKK